MSHQGDQAFSKIDLASKKWQTKSMTQFASIKASGQAQLPPAETTGPQLVESILLLAKSRGSGPKATALIASLPSYAVTQRQQVSAYAVIDSLGRQLTQPHGSKISVKA